MNLTAINCEHFFPLYSYLLQTNNAQSTQTFLQGQRTKVHPVILLILFLNLLLFLFWFITHKCLYSNFLLPFWFTQITSIVLLAQVSINFSIIWQVQLHTWDVNNLTEWKKEKTKLLIQLLTMNTYIFFLNFRYISLTTHAENK